MGGGQSKMEATAPKPVRMPNPNDPAILAGVGVRPGQAIRQCTALRDVVAGTADHLVATADQLTARGVEFVETDRGGDITFHGPGQLVAYPIVELRDPLDLRRYVRTLEEAIIGTAAAFGVEAARVEGLPGVWVDGVRKLAAVGVRVKRGVTTHGLALNVSTDLAWFDEMIPCGIPGCAVTSLERELGQDVSLRTVAGRLASELANGFGLRLVEHPDA